MKLFDRLRDKSRRGATQAFVSTQLGVAGLLFQTTTTVDPLEDVINDGIPTRGQIVDDIGEDLSEPVTNFVGLIFGTLAAFTRILWLPAFVLSFLFKKEKTRTWLRRVATFCLIYTIVIYAFWEEASRVPGQITRIVFR